MNSTARGSQYEDFVESLYRTLLNSEGFDAIEVEKNKTDLKSNSGCTHQIDIYWKFKIAGRTYQTAIECKAYDKAISIGRVRDFYGVLDDIPSLQGIMVSLIGFQSGAKKFAEHYGIDLKEVRAPTDKDWEGRIKNIHHQFIVVTPVIRELHPDVTEGFRKTLMPEEEMRLTFEGTNFDSLVVGAKGRHVSSLEEIRLSLETDNQASEDLVSTLPFPDCYYNDSCGKPIPIDSVTVRYDVNVDIEHVHIFGDEAAKAIMKDVHSGDILFFDREENVHQVRR